MNRQRILEERQRWQELKQLADAKDIAGFYQAYGDYLKWNNIISERRQILYDMARLVAERLS